MLLPSLGSTRTAGDGPRRLLLSGRRVGLAVCALVWVYGDRNPWLWVAFAAASMHAIEHFYLFSVYLGHRGFYDRGGFAGIMGEGGLTGSPLARPYMHFAYNFIVLVPLVLAWWEQRPRSTTSAGSRSQTKPTRSYPLLSLPNTVSSEANRAEEFAASTAGVVQR